MRSTEPVSATIFEEWAAINFKREISAIRLEHSCFKVMNGRVKGLVDSNKPLAKQISLQSFGLRNQE